MAQEQIKGDTGDLGSGGSLETYEVPGSAVITPYAVSVVFDGTSASGSFLPCLTFKTITGAVIARCPAPELAAGGSAEVSWFPHVANCCHNPTATDYTTAALAYGPWAYYTLSDTGSSTYLDTSGHNRTATYDATYVTQGGPPILPNVALASAILLGPGGVSNNQAIASQSQWLYSASVFTLTAWIDTSYSATTDQIIAGLGRLDTSSTSLFAIWLQSGLPVVRMFDNTLTFHNLTGSVALNDGHPHMVAASYDGTTLSLYADGIQVGASTLGVTMNTNQTITIDIGMQLGGVSPRTFNGDIAQVGFYDQVLTAANIAALYNTGASSVAGVESVLAGDTSITTGGTATNVTVATASLDAIATAHPTAADWSNNSHKITSVTDPTNPQDAATKHYVDTSGGGAVSSVFGRTGAVVAASNDYNLNQIGNATGDYSLNSHKLTNVTDPASAQDAATKAYVDSGISTAGALVKIAGSVLAVDTANFDFTSIPGTFYSLRLVLHLRSNVTSIVADRVGVRFNADTAANYDYATAGSASFSGTGGTAIQLADATSSQVGSATAAALYDLLIPSYAGTTFWKNIGGSAWIERQPAGAQQFAESTGGIWRSTAAITEITILPISGTKWVAGSSAYLYALIA